MDPGIDSPLGFLTEVESLMKPIRFLSPEPKKSTDWIVIDLREYSSPRKGWLGEDDCNEREYCSLDNQEENGRNLRSCSRVRSGVRLT